MLVNVIDNQIVRTTNNIYLHGFVGRIRKVYTFDYMKEEYKRLGRIMKKARKDSGRTISVISKQSKVRRELIEKIERGEGYHICTLFLLLSYYRDLNVIDSLDIIQDVLK